MEIATVTMIPAHESVPIACAWCLRDLGEPMGSGSHGICARHATLVLAAHRDAAKARRVVALVGVGNHPRKDFSDE